MSVHVTPSPWYPGGQSRQMWPPEPVLTHCAADVLPCKQHGCACTCIKLRKKHCSHWSYTYLSNVVKTEHKLWRHTHNFNSPPESFPGFSIHFATGQHNAGPHVARYHNAGQLTTMFFSVSNTGSSAEVHSSYTNTTNLQLQYWWK